MRAFGAEDPTRYADRPPGLVEGLRCVEDGCQGTLVIYSAPWGWHYQCSEERCEGALPANEDGSPRGAPRPRSLQRARRAAHDAFDTLWKDGHCSRSTAYAWLRRVMVLTPDKAHMERMSEEQARRVVQLVTDKGPGTPFWESWYRRGKTKRGGKRTR